MMGIGKDVSLDVLLFMVFSIGYLQKNPFLLRMIKKKGTLESSFVWGMAVWLLFVSSSSRELIT
jgi:hypothetical protein